MRITYFKIENFKNIRLAECNDPPDFLVICGGNGCGKSAMLQALMTAKEHAGSYGGYQFDARAVSADAQSAIIEMHIAFAEHERAFVKEKWQEDCPEKDEVIIEILKGGRAKTTKRSGPTKHLLSFYSRAHLNSPGFFEYIDAHRVPPKKQLSTWNSADLSDASAKHTLGAVGSDKFRFTKEYLASLVFSDLQVIQKSHREGRPAYPDSLKEIREFFDDFFAPMKLVGVQIDSSPFQYIIETPRGIIDLDDLSSGEKEVLNTYVRFHQLQPKDAIILFDEADAHLHPDLERRYLSVLREVAKGNQLWLTTHSPEMMIGAGTEALYTILKEPITSSGNQFVRVTNSDQLHSILSEIMGSRGLVSFNQKIVFLEGEESSADREVFERFYPPSQHNVSFVPAGNSATVRKTAERINTLLSTSIGFQEYYSIVDGDIERAEIQSAPGRLFQLPVYHIENILLDSDIIFEVTKDMLGSTCPFEQPEDVTTKLKELLLNDQHLKPYTRALYDARIANCAKTAYDSVYKRQPETVTLPTFEAVEQEAVRLLREAIANGTWMKVCKGRELLKAYCHCFKLSYLHFRNSVIARMTEPPSILKTIMGAILADGTGPDQCKT